MAAGERPPAGEGSAPAPGAGGRAASASSSGRGLPGPVVLVPRGLSVRPYDPYPPEPPAGPLGRYVVIVPVEEFRLPDVLRHVEAGRVVLVIAAPRERPGGTGS